MKMNNTIVIGIIVTLVCVVVVSVESVDAQQQNTTTTTTTTPIGTNFTKVVAGKEFQYCFPPIRNTPSPYVLPPGSMPPSSPVCSPTVSVVYQSPTMLVLKSTYFIDYIWKAVDLAKKEGYKIDGMTTSTSSDGLMELVAMSKG